MVTMEKSLEVTAIYGEDGDDVGAVADDDLLQMRR